MAKKDLKLYLEMEVGLKMKEFVKSLQIRRLGLITFVGTPDLEPVLHLFWIRKEKSQSQSKIHVCRIKKTGIYQKMRNS